MYLVVLAVATIILVTIIIIFGEVADVGPFKSQKVTNEFLIYFEPAIAILVFGAGIPFLILCFIKGIPSNPSTYVSIENPFSTFDSLMKTLKIKLAEAGYSDEVIRTGEEGIKIHMSHRTTMTRTYVFSVLHAPVLDQTSKSSFEVMANEYMEKHLKEMTKEVYLTLLICVEKGSKDYTNFIRKYGQSLGRYFIHIGFNFERSTMSFVSKIDGFAAGKRKKLLKDFLTMLPHPERYSDIKKLKEKEGR